jgi:hypothetical protein
MILDALLDSGHSTSAPKACLELIDALTPDQPPSWFGPLGNLLEHLVKAQPTLAEDPGYRRLRDIAIRARL